MSCWKNNLRESMGLKSYQILFSKNGSITDVFLFKNNQLFSYDSHVNFYCEIAITDSYYTVMKNSVYYDSYKLLPINQKTLNDFMKYWSNKGVEIKVNGQLFGG